MGHRLTVTSPSSEYKFDERAITKVTFGSDTPQESNARATDYGLSVKVYGKMLFDLTAAVADPTLGLAQWSLVPSHKIESYRKFEIDVLSASQIVRKFTLPQAFVMEYTEELDDETGVGTFYLHVKQKKDENEHVKIDGGFASDD
jgi:hypothetical protein